jgi:Na+/proline symporter
MSYKTGAFYFLLSRTIGSALRMFVVANVLQLAVFEKWNVPYALTVTVTIMLIWVYTFKGGIKTIVWTDTLQTIFLLLALGMSVYLIADELGFGLRGLFSSVRESAYSDVFFWNFDEKKYFVKQFLSGIFIAIVMTGLDQDLMQKSLTCRNIGDAQKNMYTFSVIQFFVVLSFLILGALLYMFSHARGIPVPARGDDLFPMLALNGHLGPYIAFFFLLGLVAATYASADSALTALTTSFCVDILAFNSNPKPNHVRVRKWVHAGMCVLIILVILVFRAINDESIVRTVFTIAGYTYGPLLGLYAFGLFTRYSVTDRWVPIVCLVSPVICYFLNLYSSQLLYGYKFGFELLMVNGALTFLGLLMIKQKESIIKV